MGQIFYIICAEKAQLHPPKKERKTEKKENKRNGS